MVTILIAATQGFAPGLTSKASTVPTLERAAARRVQMGVRRKAPTGVSQTNGRMADVLGQSAAGGGIFPGDNMDDSDGDSMVPNLDAYKRKKPQAAKLQTKAATTSTETKVATGAESTETKATDQGEPTS